MNNEMEKAFELGNFLSSNDENPERLRVTIERIGNTFAVYFFDEFEFSSEAEAVAFCDKYNLQRIGKGEDQ